MVENAFNLAVALPAVLVGFGGHTNWRCKCKLLVSVGVTRGRVARDVMGGVTKGHDVPSASAETTRISGHTL